MKVTLYFDEDAQDSDLIRALDLRGINVIGAWAAGMRESQDEEHLLWAAGQKRTLYTFFYAGNCAVDDSCTRRDEDGAGIATPCVKGIGRRIPIPSSLECFKAGLESLEKKPEASEETIVETVYVGLDVLRESANPRKALLVIAENIAEPPMIEYYRQTRFARMCPFTSLSCPTASAARLSA